MARAKYKIVAFLYFITLLPNIAVAYNWEAGAQLPPEGLKNPYYLDEATLADYNYRGRVHALRWPVDVTASLIPFNATRLYTPLIQKLVGLHSYPASEGSGPYLVPNTPEKNLGYKMGLTFQNRDRTTGITFSCAACHSADLFGKKVIGLTNRFPGSNQFFDRGSRWAKRITPEMFSLMMWANEDDTEMYAATRNSLAFVESRKPAALGLDTSLAHTALSLSHRALDEEASLDENAAMHPRHDPLREQTTDSKPAVWWNVKYKNKWLLDGSLRSGNPILTNFIWNEIGRGTDLKKLEQWIKNNSQIITELTAAVYNAEAPRITDFISPEHIDIDLAKKGEILFKARCAGCHGQYIKRWSEENSHLLPKVEQLRTAKVIYFADTPVRDVGTDLARANGMNSLLQLNDLRISKQFGIWIEKQSGYVPPPLEGIWARYPYLHNNSVPNLCELLKPSSERVETYYSGEAESFRWDFDYECNGYPVGSRTPLRWRLKPAHRFDTRLPGLSNQGHDRGNDQLSDVDRRALIVYLQTL